MIAKIWVVPHGPWPGQDGPDTEGFRQAADILGVIQRRLASGEANGDDRTRYRIASAAMERGARRIGTLVAQIDAEDLQAWMHGEAVRTIYPPNDVGPFAATAAESMKGSGGLVATLLGALSEASAIGAGVVLTVEPRADDELPLGSSAVRPARPIVARSVAPDPELAAAIVGVPRTADAVFAGDGFRLRTAETLRRLVGLAIETGEPLVVGAQAKHDVLTEVFRELHHPATPRGRFRLMYATDGGESLPFQFGPLRAHSAVVGRSLSVGLMSMRHAELDAEVDGYWFRNRLVSVPGRSHVETEAYCFRDSVARLQEFCADGVADLYVTHTGFEPAAVGFYRAVAVVNATHPLRVHPRYIRRRRTLVNGTNWPGGRD